MSKKIIDVEISEKEEKTRTKHYERMGLTLINSVFHTHRNGHGTLIRSYYRNTYTFDQSHRNAKQLWSYYENYQKKLKKLEYHYKNRIDSMPLHSGLLVRYGILSAAILIPVFSIWFVAIDLIWGSLFMNLFFGILVGGSIAGLGGILLGFIHTLCNRKKWMVNAIERIPALEAEMEQLTLEAERLLY